MRVVCIAAGIVGLIACTGGGAGGDPECSNLCRLLYQDCGYEAFPEFDSCLQGCLYEREQGGDIELFLECSQQAVDDSGECNTFDIVECAHAYGSESE